MSVPQWQTGTTEVAPGVFAYVQAEGGLCVANAGVITAPGGPTVIDALFTPSMTSALLGEVRRLSGAAPKRLLNTHHHVDHTLGNAGFPAETQVLAHAKAKAEMERTGLGVLEIIRRMAPHFGPELDRGVSVRLPDATFDGDALELDVGGRSVRLLHLGGGHTRGDVLVHLPAERVLFTGDLAFLYVTPLAFEGHVGNWMRILRRVIDEVDADTIVPGHGPVAPKSDLRLVLGYFERLHAHARAAFDADAPEEEALRTFDAGEYAEWGESERTAINVGRLYREFRGELADFE
jgi:cyclase